MKALWFYAELLWSRWKNGFCSKKQILEPNCPMIELVGLSPEDGSVREGNVSQGRAAEVDCAG